MKQLKFSNPTFHEGLNVTVRRGTKWSGADGVVAIAPNRQARIEYTKAIAFEHIMDGDIEIEHDPSCRTLKGLHEEMSRIYPNFDFKEIVTLIFFTPL